jgi:hypothetical protein
MSDPTDLPKVYGDKDIGRILKRATELQHVEPSAPPAGVTLAELEEIAAEAGIDPAYLRRAALELDAGVHDNSVWTKVVGDELVIIRELTIPGELADGGFERIVATIQAHSREHGQPSLLGRTLTWRAETINKSRTIQIVVTSRDGRTQIRLEENLTQLAAGLFSGMTAGAGLGIGLGVGIPVGLEFLGSVLLATLAPVGVVAISYIASRAIYRKIVQHRTHRVSDLFDRVVAEATASIKASRLASGNEASRALGPGETDTS